MTPESSSRPLVERWKSGDQSGAQELHRLYSARLCRLAEQQLDERLKRRVDGEDVVQSVFRKFFRVFPAGVPKRWLSSFSMEAGLIECGEVVGLLKS